MSDKDLNEYLDEGIPDDDRGWLPAWWSWLGIGAVIFSIGFAIIMHGVLGWSQENQYKEEVALHEQKHPQQAVVALNADGSNPFRGDAAAIAAGEKTYTGTCAACHNKDMTGVVGPNLVDTTWLHGNTDSEVFQVVMEGVPADKLMQDPPKGPMPAHKQSVGAKRVLEVMAFIASKNPSLKAN
jgi:cytochrome c oxidase cbb3-type subunit 3